jgi:3-hydroxyacyl-CoA dehydrogenase
MTDVVELKMMGAVGVITIDNPPANALSFAVVKGIDTAIKAAMADPACKAAVVTGAGRMFVAGADIREFNMQRPDDVPELHDMIKGIEDSPKPVVCAINGLALGGGLELSMGCHYRLIAKGAQVGQPEVNLGFIPGAGGTQRLPRLIGIDAAMDMILGGAPISADKAVALGIADELIDGDIVARAIQLAEEKAQSGGPRPTGARTDKLGGWDKAKFAEARNKAAGMARGVEHYIEAVNCIEAAATRPLIEGLEYERVTFVRLRDSDKAKAMRYMFFAEREVAKIPDLPKDVKGHEIKQAGVVGSGTMGGGIAMCFANAGLPVTIVDVSDEALKAGLKKVSDTYAGQVKRGRMTQEVMDKRMALITPSTDFLALNSADIVIEAVFEDMDLKKQIFQILDASVKPDAVLASNTSSLDINEIAAATKRADKVVGVHFFSPANVMKLVENVRTAKASKETVATAMNLSKTLDKIGVLVGVGDGFVGNRMLHVARRIAEFMVEEGALPWQVDKVLYDYGFPMGVFAVNDLAGVDVGVAIRKGQRKLYEGRRHPVLMDKVAALGRFGQKTKAGWYDYPEGSRAGVPSPLIEQMIVETSKELGITRRAFSDDEILETYLCALTNTGAHVLEEKLAIRGADIDVVWHYGYGYPRYRGGPMFHGDLVGLETIHATATKLHQVYGDWMKPSALLKQLASDGKKISEYTCPTTS